MNRKNYTILRITMLFLVMTGALATVHAQRRSTNVIDNKGTIKHVLDSSTHFVDTTYNGLTLLNDSTIVLGGKLVQVTTIDINGQQLQVANLVSGSRTDSLVVADPATGELKRISASRLLNNLTAKNGLHKDNDSVKLGGALTEATTITASGSNSLTLDNGGTVGAIRVTNLTSGQTQDSILVIDPATNNLRYVSASNLLKTLHANNGLTKANDSVQLGGNLTKNTTINTNGQNLTIGIGNSATDSMNITGLKSGNTATDSLLVVNGTTGRLSQVNVNALLQSGESSFVATAGQIAYSVPGMPATPSKVWVYRNGAKLVGGNNSTVNSDYTIAAGALTLVPNGYAVVVGDVIEIQWVK